MGRKAREFTQVQVTEMCRLFNAGDSTERIGKLYHCSGQIIGRVLRPHLGDLRVARSRVKIALALAGRTYSEYREGFEAGYRMALTHVNLHGLEQARNHCNRTLLPWRDSGYDDIPPVCGQFG